MRDSILSKTAYRPKVGVICGSGLSGLSRVLADPDVFPYDSIPHFQGTTVAGHVGEFVLGKVGKLEIICMRGRFHSYEGHTMQTTALPVKLMPVAFFLCRCGAQLQGIHCGRTQFP